MDHLSQIQSFIKATHQDMVNAISFAYSADAPAVQSSLVLNPNQPAKADLDEYTKSVIRSKLENTMQLFDQSIIVLILILLL